MSGKVKITREQAEAIESFKNEVGNKGVVMTNLSIFGGISLDQEMSIIENMEFDDLIKALYIGYEVEPEYSVGDWVVDERDGKTYKVKFINDGGLIEIDNPKLKYLHYHSSNYRHSTPEEIAAEKERRFWKNLDRHVKQYKTADLVTVDTVEGIHEVVSYRDDENLFLTNDFALSEFLIHIDQLKLVCPKESRLDVSE